MILENFWLWQFLGRLHPLVVHFPIGLLLFAALLELFTIGKFHSKLRPGINVLVLGGTVSSMIAALFGWLLAENEGISGTLLDQHRQTGIITSIICLFLLIFLFQVVIKNKLAENKTFQWNFIYHRNRDYNHRTFRCFFDAW
jgi:uncharacterized membrane protein